MRTVFLAMMLAAAWTIPAVAQGMLEVPALEDTTTVPLVPDSLLAERLRTIFENVEDFSDITVSVTAGVVKMGGTVGQPDARRRAEEVADRLEGVVYVVNNVEASTDVETRVAPAVVKIRQYWDGFVSQLPVVAVALLVVLLFGLASLMIGRFKRPAKWTGINPLVWGFVSRLIRGILVALGLLLAFDVLGITSLMGAVLGTAGIVGLALGFAFQDIVENYLAGMLLSLRRPFSVNDLVRVGEYEGHVVRLTSREVVLLTMQGNHVRLPNAHVFKNPLTNFTINPRRLFSIDVGIGVDEDLNAAMAIGVETLAAMNGVMEDPPPFARVQELGESSVIVRYHGWVDQRKADFLKARSEAVRLLKAALDEAGIDLPEPIYRVITQAAPERTAPSAGRSPRAEAASIDLRPDRKLDEQVREDLERSDDENLLE